MTGLRQRAIGHKCLTRRGAPIDAPYRPRFRAGRLNASPASSPRRDFTPGAPVAIADGPFRGFDGIYAGQRAQDRELADGGGGCRLPCLVWL
jgi:hypothetical protein